MDHSFKCELSHENTRISRDSSFWYFPQIEPQGTFSKSKSEYGNLKFRGKDVTHTDFRLNLIINAQKKHINLSREPTRKH